MSVVEEVIAARQTGMRVLGISLVSNMAAGVGAVGGVGGASPDGEEVMDVAKKREADFPPAWSRASWRGCTAQAFRFRCSARRDTGCAGCGACRAAGCGQDGVGYNEGSRKGREVARCLN